MYVERWRGVGGEGVATIRQMHRNVANAASGVYVKEIGGWGVGVSNNQMHWNMANAASGVW